MSKFPNIKSEKHYRSLSDDKIFSGKQILNLLELARPIMQAIILLDILETDEPISHPDSEYGV